MKVRYNQHHLTNEYNYLWKYLNLYKLLHIAETNSLYFTRLDKFDDPLEGLSAKGLLNSYLINSIPEEEERNPAIPLEQHESLVQVLKTRNSQTEATDREVIKQRFASCWFLGEDESIAMWNQYSNKDNVAIRFEADKLIDIIRKAAENFEDKKWEELRLGKVDYVNINEIIKHKFVGFRKVMPYSHENEYRFISVLKKSEQQEFFELPIGNITDLPFEIIAHPLMERWKFKVLIKLLIKFHLEDKLRKSMMILSC